MIDEAKVLRYQQRAAEMLALEKEVQPDDLKLMYRKLAGQWSTMAELAVLESTPTGAALSGGVLVFLD